ncbi:MAG: stage V sporulation protein AD [Bacillota bacterium]
MTAELLVEKRAGEQSIVLEKRAVLLAPSTVAGPKESRGPLAGSFDRCYDDLVLKEKSFERAECHMLEEVCYLAIGKAGLVPNQIDYYLGGDLLNQIISASFCARKLAIPFFGLYGACSTLAESLCLAGMMIEGGFARNILVAVSSHNCSAERQYRYPTEYGFQRPGYAQWTITGAGAAVIGVSGDGPRLESLTPGKVVDADIKDPYDMGSAMAPAAADTIYTHLNDLQRDPSYYDLIITGDLGGVGKKLNEAILERNGVRIAANYTDCGLLIYYPQQQVDAGASGCACSALGFFGYYYPLMLKKEIRRILLVATGALHSPTTFLQGESIPAIAHAVSLEI